MVVGGDPFFANMIIQAADSQKTIRTTQVFFGTNLKINMSPWKPNFQIGWIYVGTPGPHEANRGIDRRNVM